METLSARLLGANQAQAEKRARALAAALLATQTRTHEPWKAEDEPPVLSKDVYEVRLPGDDILQIEED
jgi:hypothetical protein